jgi:hypothetical protein
MSLQCFSIMYCVGKIDNKPTHPCFIPQQGCQILIGTTYQKGEIIPNGPKIHSQFPFQGPPKYTRIVVYKYSLICNYNYL